MTLEEALEKIAKLEKESEIYKKAFEKLAFGEFGNLEMWRENIIAELENESR